MNKKDLLEKDYFTSNPTFAALLNYFLNDGKNIIKEDDLEELDTNLVLNNPTLSYRQRDIFKKAVMKTDGKKTYLLLGIENQTKDDFYMVIRNMIYDSLSYHNQIGNIEKKNKNDTIKVKKLYPIITIVIYYSHKKWKSPKSLHDLILIEDNNILKYIPDYKLNLIEPYSMEDEDFNKLNNDLRLLFEFIKYSGNQNKLDLLLNNNDKYKAIDIKTARLIKEITKIDIEIDEEDGGEYNMCKAIEDMKKTSYKQGVKDTEETMCKAIEDMKKTARREGIEEGKASMCKAIEDMKKTARKEGIEEGKVKGKAEGIVEGETIATTNNIKTMHKNGFDIETIARALSLDINYIKAILNA